MSALSIRKLPKALETALRREARKGGKTKTEIVLEALQRRYGLTHDAKRRQELRQFFGKMSSEEFKAFQEATKPFSEIESELWD